MPQCCWFIFPSLFLSIHLCLRLQPLPKARSKTCLPAQETKWTSPPTSMTPAAADSETLRKTFVVFGLVNHINNHMPQHILSSAVGEIFCFCDSESKRFQKSTRSKFQSWVSQCMMRSRWHVWTLIQKSPAKKTLSLGLKKNAKIPSLTCSKQKQCTEHCADQQEVCKHRWTWGKISFASRLRGVTCVTPSAWV